MSIKDLSFFGDMANEETNLFNRRPSWNNEDSLDEKYLEYMLPHSKAYFSRLRPLYSFEIKKLGALNSFSHVLLRDGLVFLLRFFHLNPRPLALQTKVFIHRDLAFVVPEAWKSHIYLYETVSYTPERPRANSSKNLVIAINLHEGQKKANLSRLLEPYKDKAQFLYVLPLFQVMRGEDFLNQKRADVFNLVRELFPKEAKMVDLEELSHLYAKETSFIHCNPQRTFLSDSSLEHRWLSQGYTSPLIKEVARVRDDATLVSLSPYHGMKLSLFETPKWQEPLRVRLYEQLQFPSGALFQGEPQFNREIEDYYKIFYYSSGLLELAKNLGDDLAQTKFSGGYF